MSLYKRPLEDILASISRLNKGVVLNESEYNFGNPQVIEPDASGHNTKLHISAKSNSSAFEGEVEVTYKRLELSDLAVMLPTSIKANNITNTQAFADVLNKFYGFAFRDGDLLNDPVNLTDGAGQVTLRANPTGLGWVGSVTFTVEPGRADINAAVKTTVLPGLGYPNRLATKPFGEMFSYPNDFSFHYDNLSLINKDSVQESDWANIVTALQGVTMTAFVRDKAARYSLQNASVEFNGATVDYPRANQSYERVLVITLDETASLGLSGQLFLHYGELDTEFDN